MPFMLELALAVAVTRDEPIFLWLFPLEKLTEMYQNEKFHDFITLHQAT